MAIADRKISKIGIIAKGRKNIIQRIFIGIEIASSLFINFGLRLKISSQPM